MYDVDFQVNLGEYLPLRDVMFRTLRQAILRGDLKPGERLMEVQLAQKLGVSRTPVREAIRMLEFEGLAVVYPRRGAEVAEITEKSMRDVLEVRRALEVLAVQLACDKISKEEIAKLKKASEAFEKKSRGNDVTKLAEADVYFHDIIYEATGNMKLIQLLNTMQEQMYRFRVEYLKEKKCHERLIREHREIIEALDEHEKERAAELICGHIDNQEAVVLETIKNKPAKAKKEKKGRAAD